VDLLYIERSREIAMGGGKAASGLKDRGAQRKGVCIVDSGFVSKSDRSAQWKLLLLDQKGRKPSQIVTVLNLSDRKFLIFCLFIKLFK
jgi:hypothetical protein